MALKSVAQYNCIHKINYTLNSNGSKRGYIARVPYSIGSGSVSKLVVSFSNCYLSSGSTGSMSGTGNTLPIDSASIEINGVSAPIRFSGARTKTLANGESDTHSDSIFPSAFGLTQFAANTQVWVKVKFLHAASAQGYTPEAPRFSYGVTGTQFVLYDPASTTVSSVDDTGPFITSGGSPTTRISGYSPVLLGEFVNPQKVIIARGDSITVGDGDRGGSSTGCGWFNRMTKLFSQAPATYNLASSGTVSSAGTTDARLSDLYQYGTDAVIFYGTNDFNESGMGAQVANVIANIESIMTSMRSAGISKIGVAKLLPRATSSDSWATEVEQTVVSGWGAGDRPDQFNTALESSSADFVISNNITRGANAYKWNTDGTANGFADDRTHPSQKGHKAMAEQAAPVFTAALAGLPIAPAPVTPPPSSTPSSGTLEIDYADVADANPYTHPDFNYFANPMRVANGVAAARDSNGRAYMLRSAPLQATGNPEVSAKINFGSSNFALVHVAIGFYNKTTLRALGVRLRFNVVNLRDMTQSGVYGAIGNSTITRNYTPGDVFKVQLKRDVSPYRLVSFLNGVQVESVISPVQDFSNYRAGIDIFNEGPPAQGVTMFIASGFDIAAPQSVESVGGSGSINQYQKGVIVKLAGLDTANMTDASFAGVQVTPGVINSTSFSFDAPGDLTPGLYPLTVEFGENVYSKSATYTQTHPLKVPAAGTNVHLDSILAQIGNPNNGRYLRIEKPAGLSWKSPHSGFTVDNIGLDVSELFTAPANADIGATYQAPASIIDDNGVVTNFNIEWIVKPADNPQGFKLFLIPDYQAVYDKVAI